MPWSAEELWPSRPNKGAKYLYAFDFVTERYQRLTPMEVGRWYPTLVTTANGETLITGGLDELGALTGTTEMFNHRTNTTPHARRMKRSSRSIPRITLTRRADYFYSGVAYGSYSRVVPPGFWDPYKGTFKPVSGLRTPRQRSSAASCFVGDLRSQNLLVMGGGAPAVNTTDRIKLSACESEVRPRTDPQGEEAVPELLEPARRFDDGGRWRQRQPDRVGQL